MDQGDYWLAVAKATVAALATRRKLRRAWIKAFGTLPPRDNDVAQATLDAVEQFDQDEDEAATVGG